VKRAIAGYSGLVSSMDENVGDVLQALRAAGLEDSTRVIYTSDHGDNAGARGLWGKSTFYEESAGVPLIFAGPAFRRDGSSHTGFAHRLRARRSSKRPAHRPRSAAGAAGRVAVRARGRRRSRTAGDLGVPRDQCRSPERSCCASAKWKYCHYVAYRPQLFDLEIDPEELVDLALEPRYAGVVAEAGGGLRAVLDPEAVDARAKRRQAELLATFGGREAALARGDLGFTPAPGTAPEMN
jgi:choline-sulfatase